MPMVRIARKSRCELLRIESSPSLYCLRWNSLCISKVQSMAERFDHESREMESRVAGVDESMVPFPVLALRWHSYC
jgi:hypothetical protein